MCVEVVQTPAEIMFHYTANQSGPYSESQWVSNSAVSVPGFDYDDGAAGYPPQSQVQRRLPDHDFGSVPAQYLNHERPKSSSSTFGTNPEDLPAAYQQYGSSHPARYGGREMSTYGYSIATNLPLSPPTTSNPFMGQDIVQATMSSSTTAGRADPVPIAPNPTGLQQLDALKRSREDEELLLASDSRKRRRNTLSPERPPELTEEEKLLLRLKEEESLPWKDIAMRFQQELGKTYQVPALQMRFKRLRERIRVWTETDAFEYWNRHKFDIIAAKMLDFGCTERFPTKAVQCKWEELHHDQFASQHEPLPYADSDRAAFFTDTAYADELNIIPPKERSAVRRLSVDPVLASGASAVPSYGTYGQHVFAHQPGSQHLISSIPSGLSRSSSVSARRSNSFLHTGDARLPVLSSNDARAASFPTPRSAGTSPGPFASPYDAFGMGSGPASMTEIAGVNIGLGLGLGRNPGLQAYQTQDGFGRKRSFSSMQ